MNRQRRLILLGLTGLLLCTASIAEVYMERDADGNVIFTDRPSSKAAKPVDVSPASTYSPPPAYTSPRRSTRSGDSNSAGYESLSISSPGDDEPVRANDGSLQVSVSLSPGLKPRHHFVLLMDGNPVDEGQSAVFNLQNVDRGSHSLQVQVIDESGNTVISSDSITFHMLRV